MTANISRMLCCVSIALVTEISAEPPDASLDLNTIITKRQMSLRASVPRYSWHEQKLKVLIKDITPKFRFENGEWVGEFTGTVDRQRFVYTSDIVHPFRGQNRAIMYPISWVISTEASPISGTLRKNGAKIFADIEINLSGTLEISTPGSFLRKETYESRLREWEARGESAASFSQSLFANVMSFTSQESPAVLKKQLFLWAGEIPVPKGDNDPEDGPVGWEYKNWDKPLEGVRHPRRDDLKGCPELIRVNGGPINLYLFLRPKRHAFTGTAKFKIQDGKAKAESIVISLVDSAGGPKKLTPCPDNGLLSVSVDWDYAIDASGPLAGVIQDAVQEALHLESKVNDFVGKPYELTFEN